MAEHRLDVAAIEPLERFWIMADLGQVPLFVRNCFHLPTVFPPHLEGCLHHSDFGGRAISQGRTSTTPGPDGNGLHCSALSSKPGGLLNQQG